MTTSRPTVEEPLVRERPPSWSIAIALVGAAVIGIGAKYDPLITVGALLGLVALAAFFRWPDGATLLVVFYIFTNVGPVAMRFYGVPAYIAMGFPVLLAIPLIWYILLRREKIFVTPVFLLLLALLVVYTLGAVLSSDIALASRKLIDYVFEGVLLYFFLTNVIRTPLMLKRVVWALLLSGAFIGGLAVYKQATQTFDHQYGGFSQTQLDSEFGTGAATLRAEGEVPRISGSIGEKNRFAQNMLMLVPLGLFQLWIYRSAGARLLALLFTGLIIAGGALAYSRGAAVGFVLLFVIMALMRYIKFYQLGLIILGGYLVMWAFPQYGERLSSLTVFADATADSGAIRSADGSIRGRATDILAALLIFQDHPLVGVGPGMVSYYTPGYSRFGFRNITDSTEAHSLFPGMAAEAGLLGLICFVLILYIPLRDLMRARKRWMVSHPDWSYLATAFFQVLVSYIVTGLFLHMSYMRFFYMMLALAVVASNFSESDSNVEEEAVQLR